MTTNLAALPQEERKAIQRDKLAALWAYDCWIGRATEAGVVRRIHQINNEQQRQDLIDRFDKFMRTHKA